MITRVFALVAAAALAVPVAASAQNLDCATPIHQAQASIDKTTDDLRGMEQMPKDQLLEIHALLDDARMLLDGARHNCDRPGGDYDLARAMAKAGAARGYADAADALHFQFMKGGTTMGSGGGMKGMPGMQGGTTGGGMSGGSR